MKLVKTIAASAVLITMSLTGARAGTLQDVQERGYLKCGVSQGTPGFSNPDANGKWSGFDVDVCRAVSAAIFGDADKVRYAPLSSVQRFTSLQSGDVDMLSRTTTWTLVRDTALGLNFTAVNYYDGQGFLVRKDLGVKSAKDLAGSSVCVSTGTTTELNMADFFRENNMEYKPVAFEKSDEVIAAYDAGRCDVYTTSKADIAAARTKLKNPKDHVLLPEIISKEPFGSVVRQGDFQWFDIVKWSLYAMIEAEENGITSKNVDTLKATSTNPVIKRVLGMEGDMGKNLGLSPDWAYNIIKEVGNYGESFERNVGPNTILGLERGLNALWKDGGLQYAMPFR